MNGENSNTTQNLGALQLKFLQEQNLMLVTFVREYFIETKSKVTTSFSVHTIAIFLKQKLMRKL